MGRRRNRSSTNSGSKSPSQNIAVKKLKQFHAEPISDCDSVYEDADEPDTELSDSESVSTKTMASSKSDHSDLVLALTEALKDPHVVDTIVSALKHEISRAVEAELDGLKAVIVEKDKQIDELKCSIDDLEMYGRRNGIRIHGVPETEHEDTDSIVMDLAHEIGVNLPDVALGRSHRVGPKAGGKPRAIIAKFVGHNHKVNVLKNKNKLRKRQGTNRPAVFVNEDLTKTRADLAKRARKLKSDGKISDTWTRDGVIFLKLKEGQIVRVNRDHELTKIENSFALVMTIPKQPWQQA